MWRLRIGYQSLTFTHISVLKENSVRDEANVQPRPPVATPSQLLLIYKFKVNQSLLKFN
jgi:hypothetical protein